MLLEADNTEVALPVLEALPVVGRMDPTLEMLDKLLHVLAIVEDVTTEDEEDDETNGCETMAGDRNEAAAAAAAATAAAAYA